MSIDSVLFIFSGILLALEAAFSGSEMAAVASDRLSIRRMAEEGNAQAKRASYFVTAPQRLLGTTLLGTNLCVVANATIITYLLTKRIGSHSELLTTLILTPLVLLFGELIPKSLAQRRPTAFSLSASHFLRWSYLILRPLSLSLLGLARLFLPGRKGLESGFLLTREDITLLVEKEAEATKIEEEEKEIIQKVFSLRRVMVRETIKPINQVVALEENAPVERAVAVFGQSGYTRLPLYSVHIYNITGVITIYDLMRVDDPKTYVRELRKPALFVPEFKRVDELLQEMRQMMVPLAVVIDEYGAAIGIATIEDILEELVGEIEDDMDFMRHKGWRRPERVEGGYLLDARIELDNLYDEWEIKLSRKDIYQTLAGFLFYHLGRIPKTGEEFEVEGYKFKIVEADEKSIKEVQISPLA